MMKSIPRIQHMEMYKASSEIVSAKSVNGEINNIMNDIKIRFNDENAATQHRLKIDLICDVHTPDVDSDSPQGELKAIAEVAYEVLFDRYEEQYIDDIMALVWPYLRSAMKRQLELINLGSTAEKLPFDLSLFKHENNNQ